MSPRIAAVAVIALIAGGTGAFAALAGDDRATAPALSSAPVDAKDRAALRYVREEEKLARDVYLAMIRRYGVRPFTSIAWAEERYDRLVAEGARSLPDAMQVGVIIERKDIRDLDDRLADVQRADIRAVFVNLREGSRRHLAAFERWAG